MEGESLKVNEIFYSIQGESSSAGFPCVFVRLTGCNLRCSYCDTRYAYTDGEDLTIAEIIERVSFYDCSLVEITGGEPLIQRQTPLLISHLLDRCYKVLLETNGSIDVAIVDTRCIRIIDIKLPTSGETHRNCLNNLRILNNKDELKFVIGGQEDYVYAKKILNSLSMDTAEHITVNFSPLFGVLKPQILAEWILADRLDVRLNLQLQKIIWPVDKKGV